MQIGVSADIEIARCLIKDMQVVVLLGGRGKRIAETESIKPKAMVDIYGKPFFYYQLQLMKGQGLKNFIFCTGYKGDIIRDYFKDGTRFGVNIKYSSDGKKLLGTAGALRKALPLLRQDVMVIYGDSYMDIDYREIIYNYYKIKDKKALMVVFKNKNRYDRSNVIFKAGKLLKYDKNNTSYQMEYIDYGISILNKGIIGKIPRNRYVELSDVYHNLVKDRAILGYQVRNRFYEIGRSSSLNEFRKFIYNRVLKSRKFFEKA